MLWDYGQICKRPRAKETENIRKREGKAMKKVPFSAVKLINTLLVMMPFVFVWFWYYEPATMTANSKQVSVLALLLYATTFYLFCKKLDGFRVSI